MHINSVRHLPNIPKSEYVQISVYLGRCLHLISSENITLQNATKCLWDSISTLIELDQLELAASISSELFEILFESDTTGAIYQCLFNQSIKTFLHHEKLLLTENDPTRRELIFLRESRRLRNRFNNPEISPMFAKTKVFFSQVPNCFTFLRMDKTFEALKPLMKNLPIIIIDLIQNVWVGTVIYYGDSEFFKRTEMNFNIEDIVAQLDTLKQIIVPAKTEVNEIEKKDVLKQTKSSKRSKKSDLKSLAKPIEDMDNSSFRNILQTSNNPELLEFVQQLNESFQVLNDIFPDIESENCLLLSYDDRIHNIPYHVIQFFTRFHIVYKDFSIMSASHRGTLTVTPKLI